MDNRQIELSLWLERSSHPQLAAMDPRPELNLLSGDASFRRYFRLQDDQGHSLIAVDAPPEHENNQAFVAIAQGWLGRGIHVPSVLDVDFEQGFMLLSDLGDRQYLAELDDEHADGLYRQAIDTLVAIQRCPQLEGYELPLYDRELLMNEMRLFRDWFVERLLGIELNESDRQLLSSVFYGLAESALAQPRVCVHRDYHSRNLMVTEQDSPGVIDFQDAVQGPLTYDLVSLLKDCYIAWPQEQRRHWLDYYLQQAADLPAMMGIKPEAFLRWFDWMGVQRHLKAVGIFARLQERDGKGGYLGDIPRTLSYIAEMGERYPELAAFNGLLDERLLPAMRDSGLFSNSELSIFH